MLLKGLSQPVNTYSIDIAGFGMYARTQDETTYDATVPVKVLEDGTIASDTIINQPVKLRISGMVSDVYRGPRPNSPLSLMGNPKVRALTAFSPVQPFITRAQPVINKMSDIANRVMTADKLADAYLKKAKNLFGLTEGGAGKSVRTQFIDFVESAYQSRQLISVDGVGKTLDNMAITGLVLTQDNKFATVTFDLSLQQVRTVEVATVGIEQFYRAPAPKPAAQTSKMKNKTPQDTKSAKHVERSVLKALLG